MSSASHIHTLLAAGAMLVLAQGTALCDNFAAQMGAGYAGLRLDVDKQRVQILAMQQRVQASQDGIAAVTESLIEANATSEAMAKRIQELQKENSALGISRVTEDRKVLEQRLLKAVRDLDLLDEKYSKARQQFEGLVNATEDYLSAKDNAKRDHLPALMRALSDSKRLLNSELRNDVQGNAFSGTLSEMRLIDVRDELALVVINAGARQGVAQGMQFVVKQGGRSIGKVRAVDVRDAIAGCVVQEFESANTPMEVGQQVMLDVR